MRKMKNVNTTISTAKVFIPPMPRGSYAIDETETKFISMFWLNKQAVDKGQADIVSVAVMLDRPIIVEWNLHTGNIVTGLADLIRSHVRADVVKVISNFATTYELERECMELEKQLKEQPPYDPEGKKALVVEAVKAKKKVKKRGEDGEPYDIQVPGHFRKTGKYVCGYERRAPLRGRRVTTNTVDPIAETKKAEKLSKKAAKTSVNSVRGRKPSYDEALVCVDLKQGMKYKDISKKYNVSIPVVSQIAKRNGLARYKKAQTNC